MKMINVKRCFLLISGLNLLCYFGGDCIQVKTYVGEDAVLPCGVEPNIDATDLAVEWSRPDLPPDQYVHFQRYGQEYIDTKSPAFEGRTSLFEDEVKKGNVSLKLSSVILSDEGIYTGYIPEIDKKCSVQLIVVQLLAALNSDQHHPEDAVPEVSENKPGDGGSYDSHSDSTEGTELPTARVFPWWGWFIITLIIIIIIIISGLVYWKRQNILVFGRRFPKHANPADNDRSMGGGSEISPMNGVSVDKPGLKDVNGTPTAVV